MYYYQPVNNSLVAKLEIQKNLRAMLKEKTWKALQNKWYTWMASTRETIKKYWFKVTLFGLIGFLMVRGDLSFSLSFNPRASNYFTSKPALVNEKKESSQFGFVQLSNKKELASAKKEKKRSPKEQAQWDLEKNYIDRFSKVAIDEMKKYGIPASITLAQGILETNSGTSKLSKEFNNHFGMKCFSKKCKKGHCANFFDDHHKDFFRIYTSPWESFRSHSELLLKGRYKHLLEIKNYDYKEWAKGLKGAGYATDPQYPEKLIKIIESHQLNNLDQP